MRRWIPRILGVAVVLAIIGAAALLAFRKSESLPTYKVELDNAFGLTPQAEVRVAGVNAGAVSTLDVDRNTFRAIVEITIVKTGFGELRKDARCSVEPQSLIGEYFLDCEPGSDPQHLKTGDTIPVEQTTGTIPPDLVLSILQKPRRQQLGIIFTELGIGLAARAPDVKELIRRAVPALTETDRVLKLLAANTDTLRRLTRDSDTVLAELRDNRRDVARFVREAGDTAAISASRREELAETFRRLPAFLRELRPTLAHLSTVAERQTPALRDLRLSADDLRLLLDRIPPFTDAAEPAVQALGDASRAGTRATGPARETVREVGELARMALEPATNLRFILEHIDNRDFAVEPSPVSPGGRGFTGLEAFLRYPFVQSQAINLFDTRGYTLKLNALPSECGGYTNAAHARRDAGRTKRCNAWLGPNQPGITTPDPTATGASAARRARRARARRATPPAAQAAAPRSAAPEQQAAAPQQQQQQQPAPSSTRRRGGSPVLPQADLEKLLDGLRKAVPVTKPAVPQTPAPVQVPQVTEQQRETDQAAQGLLDFLLGS